MIRSSSSSFLIVFITATGLAAFSNTATAEWPHDPLVNLPLCTAINSQQDPVIVRNGDGGAIVAWYDWRSGSDSDIYAQRVDAGGATLWTTDGVVICDTINVQWMHRMASDGEGGALVVWEDRRVSTSGDIYAQRLDPDGSRLWQSNGVGVCTDPGGQGGPRIISDGAGGAIVVWIDWRIGGNDVYAQRISAAGTPMWAADGVKICGAANSEYNPEIVSDGAHGAIVAWEDNRVLGNQNIYVIRVDSLGTTHWGVDGYPVCTESGTQQGVAMVSDGAGGAILAWQDGRPTFGLYAQRITASGSYSWTYNGVAVATTGSATYNTNMVSDATGGAIVCWQDARSGNQDVYVQRLSPTGSTYWVTDGLALSTDVSNQQVPRAVSDGAGGAIVVWRDQRVDLGDAYAQRISASGQVQWTADGVPVCTAAGEQRNPVVCEVGNGGAIVSWEDARGSHSDVYAQNVERFGYLGDPSPSLVRVADIPNDEGGQVKLSWDASYLDTDPSRVVEQYWVFRSVPPNRTGGLVANEARPDRLRGIGFQIGDLATFPGPDGTATYYWELVADLDALHVIEGYSYVAATEGDSTAGNNDPTYFMVMALNAAGTEYWDSSPDSGYSVDNLAPLTPREFTGEYTAGVTTLHWLANMETDLAGYRLYRGNSTDFVPGPGNLVVAQSDTGYVDVAGAAYFYKISAVDIHGNESPYAFLQPDGTVSIDPGSDIPLRFALHPCSPNPMRDGGVIRFDLPRASRVDLSIYDARGRVVRWALEGEWTAAGRQVWIWDGRDGAGSRLPSGIYFFRLQTPVFSQTQKALLLE